jgi:RimJ/RimL family protein N-acetyltransferase
MSAEMRAIEELSLNAWPAQQTLLYDGWVLRFSGGYTRRANSVNPLYPSSLALEAKIQVCEAHYRQQNLPVIFKMTPGSQPSDLDARLDALGYSHEASTSVQTLAPAQLTGFAAPASPPPGAHLVLESALSEDWMNAFTRMSASQLAQLVRHRAILQAIQPETCYAALQIDGSTAACGLAVCQNGWVGFYDILVESSLRRQGYGEFVMRALLSWASERTARSAYLQVMHNNLPALRLYAKLGFREAYSYWYRVK